MFVFTKAKPSAVYVQHMFLSKPNEYNAVSTYFT